jgi:hypothetical protein
MAIVIISGGQSGVDRGALDAVVAASVAYGGWCPLDGWAEDAPEAPGVRARYPLLDETPTRDPSQRTEWNIRDSDAVLALVDRQGLAVSGGTCLAIQLAAKYGKPSLCVVCASISMTPRACARPQSGSALCRLNCASMWWGREKARHRAFMMRAAASSGNC